MNENRLMAKPVDQNPIAEQINDRAKLMMHRILSSLMLRDPSILSRTKERLEKDSRMLPADKRAWESILNSNVDVLVRKLRDRSPEMTRLRICSPFMMPRHLQNPEWRRSLWRKAKRGVT